MGETTRNTADDYDDKTTTGDGINRANEKTNRESKHVSSPHFSPDPLSPVPSCPPASNVPPPPGRGMSGREQDGHADGIIIASGDGVPCRSLTAFVRYSTFTV